MLLASCTIRSCPRSNAQFTLGAAHVFCRSFSKKAPADVVARRKLEAKTSAHESPRLRRINDLVAQRINPNLVQNVAVADVPSLLLERLHEWSTDTRMHERLRDFGIPQEEIQPILRVFMEHLQNGSVLADLQYSPEEFTRIAHDLSYYQYNRIIDRYRTKMLYEWAARPAGRALLAPVVHPTTLYRMNELFQAADFSQPHTFFPMARAAPPRKVIMHVGPTNSGKTHHALRALASAKRGLYAGPLRLLAHEVWERLNNGKIVPLEVTDTQESIRVAKDGDPKYSRVCNMVTGEEQKIVDPGAGLVSCTIEMLPYAAAYDVAVVDEIQMVANSDRGGAWTNAVLGIAAKEVHLCGEETAVPLVESMLRDTGDELIVKRYKRLTPLDVGREHVGPGFANLKAGDCIVTFSQNQLWRLKQEIEETTSFRCAVVYGRLPPEVRNDQALLFNDPDSGYDILIGSDAIGMGLNLRIKRIVFEAVRKWDGYKETLLSVSQMKQIAGRAGRFGLHGKDESGGIATTMIQADLPVLRQAMWQDVEPLQIAHLQCDDETYSRIARCLPDDPSPRTIAEVLEFVAKMHPCYRMEEIRTMVQAMEYVDAVAPGLTLADRVMFQLAPFPWRDQYAIAAITQLLRLYQTQMRVDVKSAMKTGGLGDMVAHAFKCMAANKPPSTLLSMLMQLESAHKVASLYLWLSYRMPIAFHEQEVCFQLKTELQNCIKWCLASLTKDQVRMSPHAARALEEYKIQYQTPQDRIRASRERQKENRKEQQNARSAVQQTSAVDIQPREENVIERLRPNADVFA